MRGASTSSSSSSSRIRRSHRHRQNTRRTSRVVIHSALYTGTPADFKEKGDQISFDSWDPLGLLSASSHSAFDERAQDSLFGFGGMMRTKSNKRAAAKTTKTARRRKTRVATNARPVADNRRKRPRLGRPAVVTTMGTSGTSSLEIFRKKSRLSLRCSSSLELARTFQSVVSIERRLQSHFRTLGV